ncbi:MAG: DUF1501 domain-containing protein [Betaproteobacteria bacterium]|nr:DUF1501 domain-containing protein [Betaproteobacteria bacterium]MDE2122274.1 DUF1501 domain-containing protein [Betaproteobacteria bacterium]MDE2185977.1 DUF1501 domain-containing protein [Betaproteobacteria bacterium]MDE2323420.1 DUF1501 domain-containing protein [Betaproteobacteria bacterium]
MQRRHFLQSAAAAALAAPMSRLWATPAPGGPKFILVFLRGAYDATNMLVPYANDFYYDARPHIAVPRPAANGSVDDPQAAIRLDADWALHPALRASMLPLWQAGQLAFVPFAGTRDMTRSHFETQDHIELGQGPRTHDFNDGFLNRLVQQLGGRAQPMAFTAQLPLSLRGPERVPNMAIAQVGRSGVDARQQALLESMWGDTTQAAAVHEGFAVHATVMHDMQAQGWEAEMVAASRGAINPRGFVAEAARVGGLMRASFDLGFIDVGGWDTHVNEATVNGAQGQLADKLGALGQGLAALAQAMGPAWRDTTVVVLSEFGRTFRENGNRGTDHGHGTVYWVLGGAVRGGRIAGEQLALSPATLNQNRDYPVLSEDRDLLGGLFTRLWGLNVRQLQAVFPDCQPVDLRLV